MFRFLKNYRNQVLLRRKILKYSLYAFGEIILVVIGILIAVSIDDWNDSRKKRNAFYEIMNEIAKDLGEDIFQYEFQIRSHYRKDSILRRAIAGKITADDYRKDWPELRSVITSSAFFYIHKNGFQAFQKNLEDAPPEIASVTGDLTNYYVYKTEGVDQTLKRESDLTWRTLEDWDSKYDWYSSHMTDTTINAAMLNYFVDDREYRNKATTFLMNARNVTVMCEEGRKDGLDLLTKIRELSGFEKDSIFNEVKDILDIDESISIMPCTTLNADATADQRHRIKSIFVLKNNSEGELKIYDPNPDADSESFTIGPKDFAIRQSLDGQYFRVVNERDECVGVIGTGDYNAVVEF
jgi:hypothetical protein